MSRPEIDRLTGLADAHASMLLTKSCMKVSVPEACRLCWPFWVCVFASKKIPNRRRSHSGAANVAFDHTPTIAPNFHRSAGPPRAGFLDIRLGSKQTQTMTSRLLKYLVLERFSWRCGSKKRSDGSRSALHRRRWLRFCLIFDAPDGLIPLRPEAWGRERDCRRQQSGRRTIPPSRAHDAGSCANRRRSSSSQRVLRSACA